MERRDFLRKGCSLCMMVTAGLMFDVLSSCSSLPVYKTVIKENVVTIPLTLFEKGDLQIVRVSDLGYDIAVHKKKEDVYTALLLQCTHAENELVSTGNGYVCNLHGSRFDANGDVVEGPADRSLKKFVTAIHDTNIIIRIS